MDQREAIDTATTIRRRHLSLVHSRPETPRSPRKGVAPARPVPARPRTKRDSPDSAIYAQALGDLIIAAGGKVPGRVVFASATDHLCATSFVCSLAAHSRRIGLGVLAAEVTATRGRTALSWCEPEPLDRTEPDPLALDLFNPRWPEDFANWRARTAGFADMVVVAAPPLDHSVEGALVASEFDGIVVLAHRGFTARDAIEDAIRRCRSVHARLFGIALVDGAAPSWLRLTAAAGGPSPATRK